MNEIISNDGNVFNYDVMQINNAVLFAQKTGSAASITFIKDKEGNKSDDIHSSAVFATLDRMTLHFSGEWVIEILPMNQMITLFTFIDYQAKKRQQGVTKKVERGINVFTDTHRCFVSIVENSYRNFLDMMIKNTITLNAVHTHPFFSFIRNTENFWVTNFLLSQLMGDNEESNPCKVYNACKVYGVSESYFRRLCRNAFTCGPKKQLRMWRAAHSALQLIETDQSVATIAGNNGYASSSHFSSEIKSLFGITPKGFKNLEGLLHD